MSDPSEIYVPPVFTNLFIPRSLKPSVFDEICNKPETKIEDLMDDENFSYELRHCNPNLMDFLTRKPDQVRNLIDYITVLPVDLNDTKRAHQYPMLANEIFEDDIPVIINHFFRPLPEEDGSPSKNNEQSGDPSSPGLIKSASVEFSKFDLLNKLFAFLNTNEELNEVLAGYFCNLIQKLIKRNLKKVIEFVYKDSVICCNLVKHISNISMAELVHTFLAFDNLLLLSNKPEFLLIKLSTIDKIFSVFQNKNPKAEEMAHIAEILLAVLTNYKTIADGRELLCKILSKENFDILFLCLTTYQTNSINSHICNAILALMNFYISNKTDITGIFKKRLPTGQENTFEDPIILSISNNIATLSATLQTKKETTVATAFGTNGKPFGLAKLKVLEIFETIIKINDPKLNTLIHEKNIIAQITGFFKVYTWNNLLHVRYDKIVSLILDKKISILLQSLFVNAEILTVITEELKNDSFEIPKSKKSVRKGNLGFILKIANDINKLAGTDQLVKEQLALFPSWEQFVVPILQKRNSLEETVMGGCHPKDLLEQVLNTPKGSSTPDFASGFYSPQAEQNPSSFSSALGKADSSDNKTSEKQNAESNHVPTISKDSPQKPESDSPISSGEPKKEFKSRINLQEEVAFLTNLQNGTGINFKLEERLGPDALKLKDSFKSSSESEVKSELPASGSNKGLSKSLTDLKNPLKLKLGIKKSEKAQGKKILDMMNIYQEKGLSSSIEFSYSESTASECDNLTYDEAENFVNYKNTQLKAVL